MILAENNVKNNELLIAQCKLRPDPRDLAKNKRARKPDAKAFKPKGENTGQITVGYLLWLTRSTLKISQELMAKLLCDDRIRILILAGAKDKDLEEAARLTNVTVKAIEEANYIDGAKFYTLEMIAPRLYNPLTDQAFRGEELALLQFNRLNGWDYSLKDLERFIPQIEKLNEEVDKRLYYID